MQKDTLQAISQGCVKRFSLPAGFVQGKEVFGGMGNNWERQFHPEDNADVDITLHYRGLPELGIDAQAFRLLLADEEEMLIYDGLPVEEVTPPVASRIETLKFIMGNAGENQVSNRETGIRGPRFHLEKLETLDLNGRIVLSATGWFHGAEKEPHFYYCGIFADGKPDDADCQVEEISLQAKTRELFDQYMPEFQSSLENIEWAHS